MPNQLGRDLWKRFCEGVGALYRSKTPITKHILTKLFGQSDDKRYYDDGYGWVATDVHPETKKSDGHAASQATNAEDDLVGGYSPSKHDSAA